MPALKTSWCLNDALPAWKKFHPCFLQALCAKRLTWTKITATARSSLRAAGATLRLPRRLRKSWIQLAWERILLRRTWPRNSAICWSGKRTRRLLMRMGPAHLICLWQRRPMVTEKRSIRACKKWTKAHLLLLQPDRLPHAIRWITLLSSCRTTTKNHNLTAWILCIRALNLARAVT